MPQSGHHIGRDDDREDRSLRKHEARAGQAPEKAGLRDGEEMIGDPRDEDDEGAWVGPESTTSGHEPQDSGGGRWEDPLDTTTAAATDSTQTRPDLESADRATEQRGKLIGVPKAQSDRRG